MAFCTNCGSQLEDNAVACPKCGAPVGAQPVYAPVYIDPNDHTADFDQKDISQNKVIALAAYALGIAGIIIALLAAPNSPYASFHARQALKLKIVSVLVGLISAVLCWTLIVPLAGGICEIILFVVQVICFFHVCAGKAKDAPIVSSLGFLK